MSFAGRVVMVAMNREYRDCDINIRVLVIDVIE